MTQSIARTAYAKINLGLEVLHKRSDGFHAINTVFVRVSLGDAMLVTVGDKISNGVSNKVGQTFVECAPALDVPQSDNLAYKAVEVLRAGSSPNANGCNAIVSIQKRIPTGGGLGGGSSNAASALVACNELWQLRQSRQQLQPMAATLGSDVPFFVEDVPCAVGTSRGEVLQPFPVRLPYWIVLVCAGIHVSTPWAYKALGRMGDENARKASDYAVLMGNLVRNTGLSCAENLAEQFVNDFEGVVFAEFPVLRDIKSRLYGAGAALALMSGSGSTMFGLFSTQAAAEQAVSIFPEYTTFVCRNV